MIYCKHCGNEVVKSYPGGKVKLRTNIIVFENDGKVFCKCVKCKNEVPIPIVLTLPYTDTKFPKDERKYYVIEKSVKREEVKNNGKVDKKSEKAKVPGV
jgi:hypothetical protein